MSSSNNFTVPTLSLSSSRAKKNQASNIPTKDSYNLDKFAYTNNQNDINFENKFQNTFNTASI
jgi:hypothetical protein